jgi:hypothetical protein
MISLHHVDRPEKRKASPLESVAPARYEYPKRRRAMTTAGSAIEQEPPLATTIPLSVPSWAPKPRAPPGQRRCETCARAHRGGCGTGHAHRACLLRPAT